MDSEQARQILGAWRAGKDVPGDDKLLEEALALMENNPALAEWFAAESAFDAGMRDAVTSIKPPAHLRDSILSAAKVTPLPVVRSSRLPVWFAVAVGLVMAAGLIFLFIPRGDAARFASISGEISRLTEKHGHAFGSKGGDLEKIRAWLASNGGATGFSVPKGLVNIGAVGCEVASINGATVSILCFHVEGGNTAHLYVVDRAELSDPPALGAPSMRQDGVFAVASWSDGTHSYLLAQRGNAGELRRFF